MHRDSDPGHLGSTGPFQGHSFLSALNSRRVDGEGAVPFAAWLQQVTASRL